MLKHHEEIIEKNLNSFKANFGEVRIEPADAGDGYYVFCPPESESYVQYCENIHYLDGWLYGCVQGAHGRVKPLDPTIYPTTSVYNITAIEQDGLNVRALTVTVRAINEDICVLDAIKAACTEYVKTKKGFDTYTYNCNLFNWADFEANVPNEICRKHGFEKLDSVTSTTDVNWDEQLVNENDLHLTDEEFETLKSELFNHGIEAIEDFLGMEILEHWDKDTIDNMMDDIGAQMPDEEQLAFYFKYVKTK